jgi:hypothetical protein
MKTREILPAPGPGSFLVPRGKSFTFTKSAQELRRVLTIELNYEIVHFTEASLTMAEWFTKPVLTFESGARGGQDNAVAGLCDLKIELQNTVHKNRDAGTMIAGRYCFTHSTWVVS